MADVFTTREATRGDAELVLSYIKKIAEYEKMSDRVVNTKELVEEVVFDNNAAGVIIGEENGVPIGFALYFETYSTFVGRVGLHLEDLFVDLDKRGRGYGKKLLQAVAQKAVDKGCQRLEWVCLDWNKPSQDFYAKMGASVMDEWLIYRLAGNEIAEAINK